MKLKMMVTVAAMAMAAGVLSGCSTGPAALQGQNAYGSVGRASYTQPGSAGSPAVVAPNGRVIGADPDANVRFNLNRDYGCRLGADC